jgi:hypothetical protein
MEDGFNKNDKQRHFNKIKGRITEINDGNEYCSLTVAVGHENPRNVNFSCKKEKFAELCGNLKVDDKVCVIFFPSSRFKNERWYNSLIILKVEVLEEVNL